MKTNHDGTITLNAGEIWTVCTACNQRVTSDSIHTCSPQLKPLSDEEINELYLKHSNSKFGWQLDFARAIEERHGIK